MKNENKKKLYMIGNAHLDPVWLWPWQEGFQETKATFRSALDRMQEYDDFVFTSSSAQNYEWVEQNDPAMFREIQARVAEGRWVIVGGWWIQPDCNIPSGESFVRQGLYGQRYFKEKLGVTAKVGYNVDSFGHFGMMPQILKKSGMDYYVMMRPMPNEKGLPGRLFKWESDDGSHVLAFRILFEYCSWGKDLENHIRRCETELRAPFDQLMCFYGVGNHGGGPTRENIDSIKRLQREQDEVELAFSSPNEFFADMENRQLPFPVVHDDLQHHASGCYAAHSGVKQWNRRAENLMAAAEKLSSIASWTTGQPYPKDFDRAWKNILFNQFHDILAGTSIETAYDDARNEYGEALAIASRGLNHAVQSLSWKIHIEEEENMKPIVVFNPHAWKSRVNVEVEVGGFKDEHVLVDEAGRPVAFQRVQPIATCNGRYRLSFIAQLPSLGYRVYKFTTNPSLPKAAASPIVANDHAMENNRFRIEFDPSTGYIASLRDKLHDVEVFRDLAAKPVVIEDKTDTWSHNVFHFNNVAGTFAASRVQLVEHGPVKSVIRVTSEYGRSSLVQDFTMYAELDHIDVKATIDWREQFKMLKLVFPINLIFTRQTYEQPYGFIERAHNGEEEPGQSWIDYSGITRETGKVYGVSLMNDSKYSYSIHGKEMAITLLRSPIYAHHDPLVPSDTGHYSYIDQGIQTVNYAILPHEGTWETAGTVKRAAELNQRPITVIETYHKGELPQMDSYLSVDADNVLVSVVKKAEDSDDLVIRAYETAKTSTRAVIKLPKWNRTIEADFGPCEIKTFRIPKDASLPIAETNLIEWEL